MTKQQFSEHIANSLQQNRNELTQYWKQSATVRHFYIDNVLPDDWATACFTALPEPEKMLHRHTVKEHKHAGVDIDSYNPLVSHILFAFQDEGLIKIVPGITGTADLSADPSLYGSGIFMMLQGDFLLPHLGNSHDGDGIYAGC